MDMGKIKTITNRIYADYLMRTRFHEYENILQKSLEEGYIHLTFYEYFQKLETNTLSPNKKYFVHRHDIDTDVSTAKKFFSIEKKYNIKASYYFRLSTLDFELMKAINAYGSEASYHFEEIAQYCKDHHIKTREKALENLPAIMKKFEENFTYIENALGAKLKTVCSHGDFVNRKLKIVNNVITDNIELREKLGIECEAYDKNIMQSFDVYISDSPYPVFYTPCNIFDCLGKQNTIYMLSHPRQWQTNVWVNTFDNCKRLYEGLVW